MEAVVFANVEVHARFAITHRRKFFPYSTGSVIIHVGLHEANHHAKISVKYPEYPHFADNLFEASKNGASFLFNSMTSGTFVSIFVFIFLAICLSVACCAVIFHDVWKFLLNTFSSHV
ncbi:hypothetical protein [uncultured Flavobacterium sp.]|uniref:hypothetical protein n=1 Tax=uncultured Flavobacterium sp. TaxID=165435 RepID=UPI0025957237|nr:hypothetical protein [uncultured Flavobacterium sp.]